MQCVCVVRYAMVWSDLISSDVQQQQQQQQRLQLDRWFRFHRQLYTSLVRTESLNKQCINIYRGAGAAHWPHTHTRTHRCLRLIYTFFTVVNGCRCCICFYLFAFQPKIFAAFHASWFSAILNKSIMNRKLNLTRGRAKLHKKSNNNNNNNSGWTESSNSCDLAF